MDKLARVSRHYAYSGLILGVYWRELSKYYNYDKRNLSQLRVVHTHCFALGSIYFLVVLLLEKNFALTRQRNYRKFYLLYSMGLGLTLAMLIVRGTLEVVRPNSIPNWMAWVSGLGHCLLTAGFYYFYDVLTNAVKASTSHRADDSHLSTASEKSG